MKNTGVLLKAALVIIMVSSLTWSSALAAGFDEFGYNYTARLFNGFYGHFDRDLGGGTGDAWIVMKWSRDWTPMNMETTNETQANGAWCTNHWTWYSNAYDPSTWYGFNSRAAWSVPGSPPQATYRIEEFLKIIKVDDNADEWARYQGAGAYNAGWGVYQSGIPRYVVLQDVIEVYNADTGELVTSFEISTASTFKKPVYPLPKVIP